MKKNIMLTIIAAMAMAACLPFAKKDSGAAIVQPETKQADPAASSTKAIVFEQQEFHLSKKPDIALQNGFQKILDIAYKKTMEANAEEEPKELGFIYSMRPTGAINPFAEVEVSCIIQERHKHKGKDLCGTFFSALQEEFVYLLNPEKRPAEDPGEGTEQKNKVHL